jgi:uncharacterized protein YdeI (YjbR/CyaY-like superfamily)
VHFRLTFTLYVTNRDDWRVWLEKNYQTEKEIWLVYYRRQTGKPRIPYNNAVEEALCLGWIDSINKKLDEEWNTQRFSPRKPSSEYSQTNKERLKRVMSSLLGAILAPGISIITKLIAALILFSFPLIYLNFRKFQIKKSQKKQLLII